MTATTVAKPRYKWKRIRPGFYVLWTDPDNPIAIVDDGSTLTWHCWEPDTGDRPGDCGAGADCTGHAWRGGWCVTRASFDSDYRSWDPIMDNVYADQIATAREAKVTAEAMFADEIARAVARSAK
jgi:hypothetical protein